MTSLFFIDWNTESVSDQMAAPELVATLARLEIRVGSRWPTIVEESRNGSIRRSINVSLYPLAEWIVFNWWTLLHSGRSGGSFPNERSQWTSPRRNNMRAAGDGFIWPDLSIHSESGLIRIEWTADTATFRGRDVRFLTNGSYLLEFALVQESFTDLVEAVITRLTEAGVGETPLQKEWTALRELSTDEVEFCRVCGRLGLDPFSEGVDLATSIEHVYEEIPESIVGDFFDAANPERLQENADWVSKANLKALGSKNSPSARMVIPRSVADSISDAAGTRESIPLISQDFLSRIRETRWSEADSRRPFEIGYEHARRVRAELGLSPEARFPIDRMSISVSTLGSNEPSLQGLSRASDGHTKVVLGWEARTEARTFATSRALWHTLYGDPQAPFLLTTAASPSQQTARAFAAELLAPAEGIRARLGVGIGSITAAPVIADAYAVSETVIQHQIENQIVRMRVG